MKHGIKNVNMLFCCWISSENLTRGSEGEVRVRLSRCCLPRGPRIPSLEILSLRFTLRYFPKN